MEREDAILKREMTTPTTGTVAFCFFPAPAPERTAPMLQKTRRFFPGAFFN
jgi:hypothetical protein